MKCFKDESKIFVSSSKNESEQWKMFIFFQLTAIYPVCNSLVVCMLCLKFKSMFTLDICNSHHCWPHNWFTTKIIFTKTFKLHKVMTLEFIFEIHTYCVLVFLAVSPTHRWSLHNHKSNYKGCKIVSLTKICVWVRSFKIKNSWQTHQTSAPWVYFTHSQGTE